jgi:hypothetical protein
VAPVLTALERLVPLAECPLGGRRIAGQELDLAGGAEDTRRTCRLETQLA